MGKKDVLRCLLWQPCRDEFVVGGGYAISFELCVVATWLFPLSTPGCLLSRDAVILQYHEGQRRFDIQEAVCQLLRSARADRVPGCSPERFRP